MTSFSILVLGYLLEAFILRHETSYCGHFTGRRMGITMTQQLQSSQFKTTEFYIDILQHHQHTMTSFPIQLLGSFGSLCTQTCQTLLSGDLFSTARLPCWSDQPIQSVSFAAVVHKEASISSAAQLGHCCSSFLCCCSKTLELASSELSNCSICYYI